MKFTFQSVCGKICQRQRHRQLLRRPRVRSRGVARAVFYPLIWLANITTKGFISRKSYSCSGRQTVFFWGREATARNTSAVRRLATFWHEVKVVCYVPTPFLYSKYVFCFYIPNPSIQTISKHVVIVWNRKLAKVKSYCCKSWIGDKSLIALNKIKYSTCLLIAYLSTPSHPSCTLLIICFPSMLFQNFPKLPSQHFSRVHLCHVNSTVGNILSRTGLLLSNQL